MKKIYFLLFLVVAISSCKSKNYSFSENPGDKVVFGEGGGFAGAFDQYTLFDNGQLFHQMGFDTSTNTEITLLGKKEVKSILQKLKELSFSEIKYDEPGNMYRFIEEHKSGKVNKVQWSMDDTKNAPKGVADLYKDLIKYTLKNE